jgi:hypothetical protein
MTSSGSILLRLRFMHTSFASADTIFRNSARSLSTQHGKRYNNPHLPFFFINQFRGAKGSSQGDTPPRQLAIRSRASLLHLRPSGLSSLMIFTMAACNR